jgi:hypothetical protein
MNIETNQEHVIGVSKKENVINELKNGTSLYNFNENIRSNKEIVLEAVKTNGLNFQYVSSELKGDKEIITESIKNFPLLLKIENENVSELRFNKDFMKELIEHNYKNYEFIGYTLENDLELKALSGEKYKRYISVKKEILENSILLKTPYGNYFQINKDLLNNCKSIDLDDKTFFLKDIKQNTLKMYYTPEQNESILNDVFLDEKDFSRLKQLFNNELRCYSVPLGSALILNTPKESKE